jgi:hypothetical protein
MRTISRQIMSSLLHLRICAFALVAILARPECVAQQSPEPTPQLFGENIILSRRDASDMDGQPVRARERERTRMKIPKGMVERLKEIIRCSDAAFARRALKTRPLPRYADILVHRGGRPADWKLPRLAFSEMIRSASSS